MTTNYHRPNTHPNPPKGSEPDMLLQGGVVNLIKPIRPILPVDEQGL